MTITMLKHELRKNIQAAADILQGGGVVAFPTETVYGLGADAANPQALRRVFDITERPSGEALIVHIGHVSLLDYWADKIPDSAWRLASHFWPGPLTLVLPRRAHRLIAGGPSTVALRVPDHPMALSLLLNMGYDKGLAAPSACRFGRVSPTTAEHVQAGLGDAVDMVLDGGPCQVGLESTIVCFDGAAPVLQRPGGIAVPELEEVLGQKISQTDADPLSSHAPRYLVSRYAPPIPLEVRHTGTLGKRAWDLAMQGKRVAVLEFSPPRLRPGNLRLFYYPMPAQAAKYARVLYAILHNAANARFDRILAEAPPQTADWQTVHDRLRHAATLYSASPVQPNPSQPQENHHA